MRASNTIKTSGYLVSAVSVVALGIVSWKAASESRLLMACLLIGMASSAIGMLLRWISYQVQEREEKASEPPR